MSAPPVSPSEFRPSVALEVAVPPELVDAIAARVADLLADRLAVQGPTGYLDVDGAAGYLVCSRQRIYDLVSAGRLAPRRDGRRLLFTPADLDAALDSA